MTTYREGRPKRMKRIYWSIMDKGGRLIPGQAQTPGHGAVPVIYAYREEAASEVRVEEGEEVVKVVIGRVREVVE